MKQVWVTFRKKGIHRYPDAATDLNLQDVSYLGSPHRHLFWFKVTIEVFHTNRDIEFHQFLNWIESLYETGVLDLDFKSCEMLADDLAAQIVVRYPDRHLEIEVAEDGECGSLCKYAPLSGFTSYLDRAQDLESAYTRM